MGHAPTGSGKTAAYLLPIVDKLAKSAVKAKARGEGELNRSTPYGSPRVLIMVPTKELAEQIFEQAITFATSKQMKAKSKKIVVLNPKMGEKI